MKKNKLSLLAIMAGTLLMGACQDDDNAPGNPVMNNVPTETINACFGDSLAFTINASDAEVPLSTLKAQLYFGEEMVSETVIRTKVSGEDYSGKIYVPFYKDIPDGTATLKYVLQNIHFTITEQTVNVSCTRPQYDHLVLVAEDGTQYNMPRTGQNQYAVTADFPQKLNAYILAPAYGTAGNDLTFGYGTDNAITEGSTTNIPFSNLEAGEYTVTFNTLTYEAGPFLTVNMNGQEFTQVDANTMKVETALEQGQAIAFEGVPNYDEWWIDPDFFNKAEDGTLTFAAISGNYRITADTENQYFKVEVLDGAMSDATLQADGTGALYIIGEYVGKPTVLNMPGWEPSKAICMAPIGNKVYQFTGVAGSDAANPAGKQIFSQQVNFKFYGSKGWDNEYKSDRITTDSDLFIVNPGPNDDGNIHLADGVTLEDGATYVITVDMSDPAHAVMHAVKK